MKAHYKCSGCDKLFVKENDKYVEKTANDLKIEKKPHTEEVIKGTPATCTKAGLTDGKKCSSCGKVLIEQEVIPAHGHEYGEWLTGDPAESTCIVQGQEYRVCKWDPEHKEYRYLELLDHDITKVDAVPATCTAEGNIEYWTCNKCHKYFSDKDGKAEIKQADIVVPPSHKFPLDHVNLKKATTKKAGNIEYWKCSLCGACFSDEKGTVEITEEDTVIPKINLKVTAKKKTFTAKAKKKTTIKANILYKVTKNSPGKITYKKSKGDKKITVAKNGNITVKKGFKAGKTYTVKVKASMSATGQYAAASKMVTIKIKIVK